MYFSVVGLNLKKKSISYCSMNVLVLLNIIVLFSIGNDVGIWVVIIAVKCTQKKPNKNVEMFILIELK